MSAGVDTGARIAVLRDALAAAGAGAIRLRGADWFAWATGGADSAPQPASACGLAELLVTQDEACILTDEADAARLRSEPLPDGVTFHIAPWAEPELHQTYALGAAAGRPVLSDRPLAEEAALPASLRARRMVLAPAEQVRYRALGQAAAEAVSEALRAARPGWSEYALAAAAAGALWRRGIEPARVLVAGEGRLGLFRHPLPTGAPLGRRALLAVTARRLGLFASLARTVAFGPLTVDERTVQDELLRVEATAADAAQPGASLSAVYHAFDAAYRHAGRPDALRARDQGGITGYAPRELLASPSTATSLDVGMAFALNPAFPDAPAAVLEDTFLLGPGGLEPLTLDPGWPAASVAGRPRPLWLEAP